MNRRNTLKLVHVAGTIWLILSVGYLLALALRQAGFRWLVIFSLSGYSVVIVFLLISLYLFAIFRGVARSQKTEIEHPLTTSVYYMFFYDISPFLGALAGAAGAIGVTRISHYLLVIAIGSLWATFLVWIIIDPAIGLVEMLSPASRTHRQKRLAQSKAQRQQQRLYNQRLLAELQAKEQAEREQWGRLLKPQAEELAALLADSRTPDSNARNEAVNIGVHAWQTGGLNCMRQLHSMAIDLCKKKYQGGIIVDYISAWWDGIGRWRNPSLG